MTDGQLGIDSLPQCMFLREHQHELLGDVISRTIRLGVVLAKGRPRDLTREEFAQLVPPMNTPGCLQNLYRADVCRALATRGYTVAGKTCV